jgi:hypothetical protein
LTSKDFPEVAEAIVMALRKRGNVSIHDTSGTRYVRISGNQRNVLVLSEDWVKVLPYLADSSLDPNVYPPPSKPKDESLREVDEAWILQGDDILLMKVLALLKKLFPKTYPTSKI